MERTSNATEAATPAGDGERRSRGLGFNQVTLVGRLTADPTMHFSEHGMARTEFRLATNDREDPEFHDVVTFGKLAERVAEYQRKGSLALISGHLHTDRWQSADGQNHQRVRVIGERVQFLDRQRAEQERAAEAEPER